MRNYLLVSGIVFGAVAIVHVVRLALNWPLVIAAWNVPQWVSVLGIILPGVLCTWAISLRLGKSAG